MNDELKHTLNSLHYMELPFHPVILVFATGQVSEEECLPMRRNPMPKVGTPFDSNLLEVLAEAVALNPSIHDGAIIFDRKNESESYTLSAWSMRIVSKHAPHFAEPNLGAAYNSALSLSMARSIDMCCIIAPNRMTFFQCGKSYPNER